MHLLHYVGFLGGATPFSMLFLQSVVGRPSPPATKHSLQRNSSGLSVLPLIRAPCLPHVLDPLFDLSVLPPGGLGCGFLYLGEVLSSDLTNEQG